MRRAPALVVAALVAFPAGSEAAIRPAPAREDARLSSPAAVAVQPFRKRLAMRHLRRLVAFGPRPAGSAAARAAERYVRRRFSRLGYRTRMQRFPLPQGGRSRNVVAWLPRWRVSEPNAAAILGGHLDSVPGSPGANDNASGVAVLLELARAIAAGDLPPHVRLVAFGAEERQPNGDHHLGSRAYVRRMRPAQREALGAMVSVDMIGKVAPLTVGWTDSRSQVVVDLLDAADRAGVPAADAQVGDVSDHVPFERAGLPAAHLWTGFEPNHHEPTDVVSNVAPRALGRAGELLQAFLEDG